MNGFEIFILSVNVVLLLFLVTITINVSSIKSMLGKGKKGNNGLPDNSSKASSEIAISSNKEYITDVIIKCSKELQEVGCFGESDIAAYKAITGRKFDAVKDLANVMLTGKTKLLEYLKEVKESEAEEVEIEIIKEQPNQLPIEVQKEESTKGVDEENLVVAKEEKELVTNKANELNNGEAEAVITIEENVETATDKA